MYVRPFQMVYSLDSPHGKLPAAGNRQKICFFFLIRRIYHSTGPAPFPVPVFLFFYKRANPWPPCSEAGGMHFPGANPFSRVISTLTPATRPSSAWNRRGIIFMHRRKFPAVILTCTRPLLESFLPFCLRRPTENAWQPYDVAMHFLFLLFRWASARLTQPLAIKLAVARPFLCLPQSP